MIHTKYFKRMGSSYDLQKYALSEKMRIKVADSQRTIFW